MILVGGRGRGVSHTANFPVQCRAVGVHDHSLLYLVVLGPVLSDEGWWWLLVMVDGLYGERLVAHSQLSVTRHLTTDGSHPP